MTGAPTAGCTRCSTLRWFLTLAGLLIAALYLQPGWAVRISGLVPSPLTLGLGICGIGLIGFGLGLWRLRRAQNA